MLVRNIEPIKKIILNLGLIFDGIKIKNIINNKKIIFSAICVVKFFTIFSFFKILSIICAWISTPGTVFPFEIFTISKSAWAEDPIKIILFSILFWSKSLLIISTAEI